MLEYYKYNEQQIQGYCFNNCYNLRSVEKKSGGSIYYCCNTIEIFHSVSILSTVILYISGQKLIEHLLLLEYYKYNEQQIQGYCFNNCYNLRSVEKKWGINLLLL